MSRETVLKRGLFATEAGAGSARLEHIFLSSGRASIALRGVGVVQ